MVVQMDNGPKPGGKPKTEKKGTDAERATKAQVHRWSRTHNDSVRQNGADGRAGV